MKKGEKTKLKWLAAICLIALILNQLGYLGQKIQIPGITPAQVTTPTTGETGPTITSGIVTSKVSAYDSLDVATARTVGTNVNVYWYAYRSAGWVLLGSGDAADVNIAKGDNNIVYAVCSIPSAQNFYVDYDKMISMNSRIQNVEYKDITGDSVKEYVFRYNIAEIPFATGTGKFVMPTLNVYLLSYDNSFSWPAAGKPSDITSIGTTKVTKYIEWYVTLSAEKKSLAISKIVLSLNSSDTSKATLKKLNIPGIGYLDGSSFEQDVLSSEIKWTYKISGSLYGADYVKLPVNSLNKFEFTTAIEFSLSSGDKLGFTLYIYYFDGAETVKSTSDLVGCSA